MVLMPNFEAGTVLGRGPQKVKFILTNTTSAAEFKNVGVFLGGDRVSAANVVFEKAEALVYETASELVDGDYEFRFEVVGDLNSVRYSKFFTPRGTTGKWWALPFSLGDRFCVNAVAACPVPEEKQLQVNVRFSSAVKKTPVGTVLGLLSVQFNDLPIDSCAAVTAFSNYSGSELIFRCPLPEETATSISIGFAPGLKSEAGVELSNCINPSSPLTVVEYRYPDCAEAKVSN